MFTDSAATTAAHDPLTIFLSSLTTLAIAVTTFLNHRKGKKRDTTGTSVLDRIEKKIDANHTETMTAVKELDSRVDDIEKRAEKNTHLLVGTGPLEDNGIKSRVEDLERWRRDEMETELEQLRKQRGLHPADVGTLTPRTV